MKKFKKIIGYLINKEKKLFVHENLLGSNIKVLRGTIRHKVDYDDAWFYYLVKNSETVFDIGANIGYMSLIAVMQSSIQQVLLLDPNPDALSIAAQNIIINGYGYKAKFISAFVGERDDEKIKFFTVGTGAAGSMFEGHAETASALNKFYMVDQITIDTLVKIVKYIPDLIKIDVEGAESFTLKGAVKTAKELKSKFFIEMHSPPELSMLENAKSVLRWCNENKYNAYYLKEGSLLKNAEKIAHRGKCHLLLLPDGQIYPDYLKEISQGSELPKF